MKAVVGTIGDGLTEVIKGAAGGAVIGAINAAVKVVGSDNKAKNNVADIVKKSKPSISKNTSATTKKTKSGK